MTAKLGYSEALEEFLGPDPKPGNMADAPVRDAFRERAHRAVDQFAQSANPELLAHALAASNDVEALARALAGAATPREAAK
jgi:hypothetical protein